MSLGRRALLALLLTVAFYLVALAVAAGLVAIPIGEWALLHRVNPLIVLGSVLMAGLIVWSIVPRPLPPPPPHVVLDSAANPRLFAELRDVARLVSEPMPVEVSLDLTVNAGVTQRGGALGIGGRRVVYLGLPLLQILRVTELKAVIAHEFGHFVRGDARLAPWVYRSGATIRRAHEQVDRYADIVHLPFALYARLFQRVTMRISRRQEVLADELAARTVGAEPLIGALRSSERAAMEFGLYWRSEMVPVLESGHLPPLTEGFTTFRAQPATARAVDEILSKQREQATDDRRDSHPPLAERERALRSLPARPSPVSELAAIALLDDVPRLEPALVTTLAGGRPLTPVAWEDVGERVVLPRWHRMAFEIAADLQAATPAALPELTLDAERIGRALAKRHGADAWLSKERATNAGLASLEAALGLAFARDGWHVDALPGTPITLTHDGKAIDLHGEFERLAMGQLSALSWRQWCAELGIDRISLLPDASAAVSVAQ